MMGKKYSEEQIIRALHKAVRGAKGEDVRRRLGIDGVTLYKWKATFAGMQVSDARRLRQLEDENRRLEQMVADQALDIQALRAAAARLGGRAPWAPRR